MTRHSLLLSAALSMTVATLAAQAPPGRFRFERTVVVSTAGPQHLDVNAALLAGAQKPSVIRAGERSIALGGLGDLRLFSSANAEVPYLLMPPSSDAPRFLPGRILAIKDTEKTSGFEVDLDSVQAVSAIDLSHVRTPFLKRFTLEGSGDRERWTLLLGEGTAFFLPQERLRHTTIEFPAGPYRYLRVTWDDTNSGRVALPDQVAARLVTVSSPGPMPSEPVPFEVRRAEPGRSRFRITLPAARMPIVALDLTIGGGHLLREARVFEASLVGQEARARLIGEAQLNRVIRDAIAADALRVPISPPEEPQIELVVDDGNNPPLELKGVKAVFAELPWIYFESPAGSVTARYGDPKLTAPRYDLEAARDTITAATATAAWPAEPPIAIAPEPEGLPMPATGSALDAAGFAFSRDIPAGPAGLVSVPLDAAVMSHSGNASRGLRDLRVVDRSNMQVPYLLERRDGPLVVDARVERRDLPAGIEALQGRPTTYIVNLPYTELPSARLALTTRARVFQRTVTLGSIVPAENRVPIHLARIATMQWTHADDQTVAPPLVFALPESRHGDLFLLIDEGDNQPLPIENVTVLMPSYALRLFRQPDVALRLIYGRDDIQPPQYDLQLLAPQVMGRIAEEVAIGPEQGLGSMTGGGETPMVTPAVFWASLALAVVVLLIMVVRLVRRDATA